NSASLASNLTQGTGITAFTYNGGAAATVGLANTAISPGGTYGNSTTIPQFQVNAQGQITGETNVAISASVIGALTSINAQLTSVTATGANTAIVGSNTTASGVSTGNGVWGTTIQSGGRGVIGQNANAAGQGALFSNTAASGASAGYGIVAITAQSGGQGIQ